MHSMSWSAGNVLNMRHAQGRLRRGAVREVVPRAGAWSRWAGAGEWAPVIRCVRCGGSGVVGRLLGDREWGGARRFVGGRGCSVGWGRPAVSGHVGCSACSAASGVWACWGCWDCWARSACLACSALRSSLARSARHQHLSACQSGYIHLGIRNGIRPSKNSAIDETVPKRRNSYQGSSVRPSGFINSIPH